MKRFASDRSGSYLILTALLMPVIVGSIGLGLDVGSWYRAKQSIQHAADGAAASAAAAYAASTSNDIALEAESVSASDGFVVGQNSVTMTVNRPPSSGAYASDQNAVEVILSQPQGRYLSAIWSSAKVPVSARAVAIAFGGSACVLALDSSAAGAISTQGSTNVSLNGCQLFSDSTSGSAISAGGSSVISAEAAGAVGSVYGASNITTTDGITTGDPSIVDPYASMDMPNFSGCDQNNFSAKTTETIYPGVYCGGMSLNAGANVTLSPGIYYLDRGNLSVNGSATLSGTGVTLVFTSSNGNNYATATINGGATVNLTAPTTGPTAGIVMWGDRNMSTGTTFKLDGGSSQILSGAVYIPKGAVEYSGGTSGSGACSQIIGDTVSFTGSSSLSLNCGQAGTKPIGSSAAKLVE